MPGGARIAAPAFAPLRRLSGRFPCPRCRTHLTTVALLWVVWALFNAQFNWVDEHRRLLYPDAGGLGDERSWMVLAPRALGGTHWRLCRLDAAFMELHLAFGMVSLAYLLAIVGMVLVWSLICFIKP